MTRKDGSPLAASASTTNSIKRHLEKAHVEPTSNDTQRDEAGKKITAPPDTVTSNDSFKQEKTLELNPQRRLLSHALYTIVASLLLMFTINRFKLVPIAEPCSPESSVRKTDGATNSSEQLSGSGWLLAASALSAYAGTRLRVVVCRACFSAETCTHQLGLECVFMPYDYVNGGRTCHSDCDRDGFRGNFFRFDVCLQANGPRFNRDHDRVLRVL